MTLYSDDSYSEIALRDGTASFSGGTSSSAGSTITWTNRSVQAIYVSGPWGASGGINATGISYSYNTGVEGWFNNPGNAIIAGVPAGFDGTAYRLVYRQYEVGRNARLTYQGNAVGYIAGSLDRPVYPTALVITISRGNISLIFNLQDRLDDSEYL